MTGVSGITRRSTRLIRTLIEIIVLAADWLLGGSVGVGTVLYALTVGVITQFFLSRFAYRSNDDSRTSLTRRVPRPDPTKAASRRAGQRAEKEYWPRMRAASSTRADRPCGDHTARRSAAQDWPAPPPAARTRLPRTRVIR